MQRVGFVGTRNSFHECDWRMRTMVFVPKTVHQTVLNTTPPVMRMSLTSQTTSNLETLNLKGDQTNDALAQQLITQ